MGQKIAKLNPHIVSKIWGGKKIAKWKELQVSSIGETWEVSTHKEGTSMIGTIPLNSFLSLNYLVKLIDTSDHLSIQVHPDDEYASEHENDKGKTECWLILDAEEGAGIYLGFKPDVTKKEFKTAVLNNVKVQNYLNFIPVKKGDFFKVPAGSIHAIGSGVSLLEVQQSSGVTYRVWDWARVDEKGNSRKLHLEKAFEVINFSDKFQNELKLYQKSNLFDSKETQILVKHEDFICEFVYFSSIKKQVLKLKKGSSFMILEGEALIDEMKVGPYQSHIAMEDSELDLEILFDCYLVVVS